MEGAMEFKSIALELKASDDGAVEGYGSVFGVTDDYGDIIAPGAFAKSIAVRAPKMLWQHKADKPIGAWDEIREDAKGLFMRGRIAGTALGQEARELVKMGAMGGLSIGFRTKDYEMQSNARILKEVDLWEVSFVTFPANEMATITGVKSIVTERDAESALRAAGLSKKEALTLLSVGWGGIRNLRDAGDGLPDGLLRDAEAIKAQLATFLKETAK
jgi:HK97 family phage prohead protease